MERRHTRLIHSAALVALAATTLGAAGCERQRDTPSAPRARADIVLPVDTQTIEAVVPKQATLETILRQHELPAPLVQAAIESTRAVFNPRQLRAERPYRLVLSIDGLLSEFEYQIDADRFLRIVNRDHSAPEKLDAKVLPYEKDTSVVAIRGRIDRDHSSLISAIDETGERVQLAMSLAELFSGQIDFENDLQPGDSFEVLFETTKYEGAFAGYGAILGARFTNDGKEHQAYRWVHPDTREGRVLRRARAVAEAIRPGLAAAIHAASDLGVFSQPPASGVSDRQGAPRRRLCRADGHARSWRSQAASSSRPDGRAAGGRQVRIRHASGFESYYLHLSAFAKGIRAGAHVDQGQLIGRVGSTGTATGPHLDYRLRRNGVFVNPRREHARQPPGEPIARACTSPISALPATGCCSSFRPRSPPIRCPPPTASKKAIEPTTVRVTVDS